ncbi:outer membrane lipoprotein carrier protein LolA [Gracilibacillus caseinilyticus]|uniref:Outer membrane lipoprotein carrier protein LolA n=1 Tax=Gracilibacillus caseinilyticus TaxID=2932256 RepID=A0ABY4EXX3_9BACI|nr:outer membrane lipoprotein carrier protein LolA [Gracilibacillus caseinilyticus]UOQ49129.1 outer membrane lipoprotein carrier protein LolA [Gracilibacillus caseinilyticus]
MKKYTSIIMGIILLIVLSACGDKSKDDVVEKLESMAENMSAYQSQSMMTLKTGKEDQVYRVDVTHKKKDFYRVLLKNENDEESSQIILRNDDGVFVLTPALNKSFKFQSEWPANNSQPYLFQSLIQDLVDDSEATFTATDNYYVFETKTSYESNSNLPYQTIYFDKKTYAPVLVEVLDRDKNTLVEVEFTSFELDPELPDNTFDMETNMTSSIFGVPVMAQEDMPKQLSVLYPSANMGSELVEENQMDLENGKRVILSYQGEKNYTIIQETVDVMPTSAASPESVNGEPVDLGFTVGAQTNSSLEWHYQGVNYYLASEQLTKEEMQEVASSMTTEEATK